MKTGLAKQTIAQVMFAFGSVLWLHVMDDRPGAELAAYDHKHRQALATLSLCPLRKGE